MSKAVGVGKLGSEIADLISQYTEEVTQGIDEELEESADEIVDEIKASNAYEDQSGDYRKSFKVRKEKGLKTVHSKDQYQLTHLLENGHAKAGGGRVAARPHIGPAFEKVEPKMMKRIEDIVQNGGKK